MNLRLYCQREIRNVFKQSTHQDQHIVKHHKNCRESGKMRADKAQKQLYQQVLYQI